MEPIRTFLAIPLPKTLTGYLKTLPEPMINQKDHINWVKRENIHITLNFLGDTNPENIEAHSSQLEKIVGAYPNFEIGTLDTGIYPHANDPRVLWVGVAPYGSEFSSFKRDIDRELKVLGYTIDKRPFQPHITLARVKTISRKSMFVHKFLSTEVREFNFEVNEMVWLKSTLTPQGAEYEQLKSFKFKTGGQ